ncbi:hypothetical protein HN358_03610 [Candidatus Uhrbacteria bacterium]|jgi:hypothetical protein|nr:hypothetical protein [Candidatus Uhrbacteria bacterium]MBT7717223.1 hypothetical protein [Candidatus Uhrbacteria bacterium]
MFNKKEKQKRSILLRIAVPIGSFAMWLLSLKVVRNWIWKKVETKGKEKIIDAKAKIVEKSEKKTFLK